MGCVILIWSVALGLHEGHAEEIAEGHRENDRREGDLGFVWSMCTICLEHQLEPFDLMFDFGCATVSIPGRKGPQEPDSNYSWPAHLRQGQLFKLKLEAPEPEPSSTTRKVKANTHTSLEDFSSFPS